MIVINLSMSYSTLPVKLTAARSGEVVIPLPNTGPEHGTKFKTPKGKKQKILFFSFQE